LCGAGIIFITERLRLFVVVCGNDVNLVFAAFTIFSACEYLIAVANILFHFTAVHEFGKASWCLLDDHNSAVCYGSSANDARHSLSYNGPTTFMTDYDNNDRKKLS